MNKSQFYQLMMLILKSNNMKKHTNLGDSIFTMKKPDTSWHSTLVGVVAMIAVTFIIYVVMMVIS